MRPLLILEKDPAVAEMIDTALGSDYALEKVRCGTLEAAKRFLVHTTPEIVLAELELTDGKATELIPENHRPFPVVVLVEPGQEREAVEAIRLGALDYVFQTPEALGDIRHVLERACREWEQVIERRNAEDALRRSEQRYALVSRGASVGLWDVDYQTGEMYFSRRLRALLAYSADEPFDLEEDFQGKIHPEDQGRYRRTVVAHLRDHTPYDIEIRIRRKDRTYRWFRVVGQAEWDEEDNATRVAGSIEDITTRKEAEETATRLGRLIDQSLSEIYVFDPDTYMIKDANRGARENLQFSLEELREKSLLNISPGLSATTLERLLRPLKDGIKDRIETRGLLQRKDGSDYPLSMAVQRSTYGDETVLVAIVNDESEREAAEAERSYLESQLRQAQKMETIGTLAGGIAHDFNNILSPILGYADLALAGLDAESRSYRQVQNIIDAAAKAKNLVRQILTFSRRSDADYQPVKLSTVLSEAMTLIRASIPATIEVVEKIPDDAGAVIADQTQLHQIVLNLCTNALQAMPERDGRIEVVLEKVDLDTYFVAARPALRRGPYFKLTVKDNGSGMSPETMDRIFEPFFTTKDASEGTGLGLSVVHGLVRSHGGDITVDSEIGVGTTFTIFFPYVEASAEEATGPDDRPVRGTERVLFVDDAANIAGMVTEMLSHLGYQASVFTNPIRAFDALKENPADYDIVVTDQTMPGLTGLELAAKIQSLRKNLPVVLVSGISETLPHAELERVGVVASLMKPLTINELGGTIRAALDGRTGQVGTTA